MAIPGPGEAHYASTAAIAPGASSSTDCGTTVAGQIYFPGGCSLFSGVGVPGKLANGKVPVVGDIWIRLDGAVGSLLYRCTVPAAGTWVVVL